MERCYATGFRSRAAADESLAQAVPAGAIRFAIEVADGPFRLAPKSWQRIGTLSFVEAVASYSTDHRLHFTHPKYRK